MSQDVPNPPSPGPGPKDDKLPLLAGFAVRHWMVIGATVAIAALGVVGMCFTEQGFAVQVATDVGIVLSTLGVIGAVVIFARQSEQNSRESIRHKEFMARTDSTLGKLSSTSEALKNRLGEGAANLVADGAETPEAAEYSGNGQFVVEVEVGDSSVSQNDLSASSDEDQYPAESLGLRTQNGEVIVYDPSDVKLWMLAAVVKHWEDEARSGRWNLGTLRGAAQRKGHGRNSWFLVFENPDTGEFDYYRVSTGGRGKKEPTVTPTTADGTNQVLNR
ncbi:hypothetical protein ACLBYD_30035 [Rhodococcus sp. C26F]